VLRQFGLDPRDFSPQKVVIFPQLYRTRWTGQIEYSLTASSDHMDMSGPVIVRIDRYTQPVKPEDLWALSDFITVPKRLGFTLQFALVLEIVEMINLLMGGGLAIGY
jgi:hypothetical protein